MSLNREKFVELMRSPEKMSGEDYTELEKLLSQNSYFQSGHTLLAKASRLMRKRTTKAVTKRAAIYATDRGIFKSYLLKQSVIKQAPTAGSKTLSVKPSQIAAPHQPTQNRGEMDKVISEIYENLAQWEQHRSEYLEWDSAHPEEIVIQDPEADNTEETSISTSLESVEQLKNQVAEEVQAEEEIEIEKKKDDIPKKPNEPGNESDDGRDQDSLNKATSIALDILKDAASLVDPLHRDNIEAQTTPEEREEVQDQIKQADQEEGHVPALANNETTLEKDSIPSESDDESTSLEDQNIPDQKVHESVEPTASKEINQEELDEVKNTPEDKSSKDSDGSDSVKKRQDKSLISSEELSEIVDKESAQLKPPKDDIEENEEVVDELTGVTFSKNELTEAEHRIDSDTGELEPLSDGSSHDAEPPEKTNTPQAEEKEKIDQAVNKKTVITVPDIEEPVPLKEVKIDTSGENEQSAEASEAELSRLDSEKQELKLTPGHDKERKFRLSVMKRSIKFTKEKPTKSKPKKSTKAAASEATSTSKKSVKDKKKSSSKAEKAGTKTTAVKKKATSKGKNSGEDEKKKS